MSKELLKPSQYRKSPLASDASQDHDLELSENQKQELTSLYEDLGKFTPGKIISGTVISKSPDGVLLGIDYKSEGLIPTYEFNEHELKNLAVGSNIDVVLDELENQEGNVVLSYEKAKEMKAWNKIIKLFEENKPVEGIVTHKVKGGLSVDIGIPAFLPGSQVDVQRITDFDQFVGKPITANIIKINQKRGNVIISRRKYLSDQRSEVRKQVISHLEVGQTIQGVVKNITNYGAFIDIGGVDGLLHITDMTWGRISHPSELFKIGDTITAKVLSFDKTNEKISLGVKQLTYNPWSDLSPEVQVGAKLTGKPISSITDYGLFVEVQKGIEGLVHISEVSWTDRIPDLSKQFHVGQLVDVMVVSLDKEAHRMSLSIRQLEKNPVDAIIDSYEVGQKVRGKISNITDFGVFIPLAAGIDGLVHISDFSWTEHIEHPSDKYKKGDEIEAVIIAINKQTKRISLGIKQLTENPYENLESKYPIGSMVEGEVTKVTNFGAFVKLPSGVEGLVHISEVPANEKLEDALKVGQKASFRVVKPKQDEQNRLALSMKSEDSAPTEKKAFAKSSAEKPAGKAKRSTEDKAPKAEKKSETKSQLQLELEKHAARQKDSK